MKHIKNKAKQVVLASIGINFSTGMMYTWSLISKELTEQFNWTSKEASLPYTINTVCFVLAMVVFGKIQDSKGPRFTGTLGTILIGLGFLLSGFTKSATIMLFTIGLLAGAGTGMIVISTTPPALKWYSPQIKGKITGILAASVGMSSIFYSILGDFMLKTFGIPKTFIYIGIGVLVGTLILAQLLVNPPEGFIPQGAVHIKESFDKLTDYTWKEMLNSVDFYKLWLMLGFSSSAGLMIISHISNIARLQVNWGGGFLLVMFLGIFNTLGRIIGGSLSDKIGRTNLMKIIFVLQGINMALFASYRSIPLIALGVGICGLCYGAGFAVLPAALADKYGNKNFGINYGLMFTGWGLGGIIGPMMGAAIFDATNSYILAYKVALILLIITSIVAFTFKDEQENWIKSNL
ncbi:L-lactate MFS transporter [Natronincola ferrireducens]|uniref:Nitrate/nitrite transporter NarK n=1 Tax=Natronincola ferrireducens TaxID=393762 RepID=A0A1G9GUL6_9FIRM|nr:OFA family MFS transporter [Natronincola ferrireducens]SDL04282.1 Nitrate/nitrite transporter NarK [Natronincola ferrireducens]